MIIASNLSASRIPVCMLSFLSILGQKAKRDVIYCSPGERTAAQSNLLGKIQAGFQTFSSLENERNALNVSPCCKVPVLCIGLFFGLLFSCILTLHHPNNVHVYIDAQIESRFWVSVQNDHQKEKVRLTSYIFLFLSFYFCMLFNLWHVGCRKPH